ncbi:hypothetical protein FO519_008576 [Halicephalobus sp. NKZ332]|nr:hypothetical protein FO519_008576 [Halicephalobus sp. NKZ332]
MLVDFRDSVSYLAPAAVSPQFPVFLPSGVPRPNPPTIAPPIPTLIPTTPPPFIQYAEEGNASFQFSNPNTPPVRDDLQVVHPPAPNEQDWVMATGNESAIDNVLAISLVYGGRLVSMGYYYRYQQIYYYAIMHKYDGPVFLKPNPYTYTELVKVVKENEELSLGLTQLCGQDNGRGEVTFSTYWERIPGVSHRIWFPGTPEADVQRRLFERDGFRLTSLCGYSVQNRAQYVGVWMKPSSSKNPYEAYYGLTLSECISKDKYLSAKGYIATQFKVFNNGRSTLCTAIWEYNPGKFHVVEVGENINRMYRRIQRSDMLPRQVSHFFDGENVLKYVVLWSNVNSYRYPNPPELWEEGTAIPVTYLKGAPELLNDDQLDFITKRVEHFMRDLDIPGLSLAISKKEQLKFAAGFGYSNVRKKEAVTPHHQFRVGSVSKPITAAAILILVEQEKLDLDDHVFGRNALFGMEFAKKKSYGKYLTDITVRHLLEHTAGGWNNLESDAAWLEPQMSTKELIEFILENVPLTEKPGTKWIYSNFGYQLLGYIIERKSGLSYEEFVKKYIWEEVGVSEIQLARPTLGEKARREVLYYMSGNKVGFNPYEMLTAERIGPWGGWIASPIELLQFMSHFDGFDRRKDILSKESIEEWAIATKASNDTYGES